MSKEIPNLWPKIEVDVVSPIALLRHQASQLVMQSSGLLEGEVKTAFTKSGGPLYEFRVIAPALDRYTYDLFKVSHGKDLPYPVRVEFEPWKEEQEAEFWKQRPNREAVIGTLMPTFTPARYAATPQELLILIREVLQSPHASSVISSLISRINEERSDMTKTAG